MPFAMTQYRDEVQIELIEDILPFYITAAVDEEHGGYYGYISNDLTVDQGAFKGLVQHSRILWTFAQAYRRLQEPSYLEVANRAYRYLTCHFWDSYHKGMIWLVDAQGQQVDTHKIIYGQAFAIYGLSEYFLASGDKKSLEMAVSLFNTLESKAVDAQYGGYFEAFSQDWRFTDSINVDETAVPTVKSMNTQLHMLEAYSNLLRAWDTAQLRGRLRDLIRIMLDRIINQETAQMKMHFDEQWHSLTDHVSYGHDIEASWLMVEAAELLAEKELLAEVAEIALRMAQVAYDEGLDGDGSLHEESHSNDKVWWVQAEAMVGFFNAYQLSGKQHYLDASRGCWQYVKKSLLDRQHGEWIWGLGGDGTSMEREKAGLWKSPYHNGRACLELMQRIGKLDDESSKASVV